MNIESHILSEHQTTYLNGLREVVAFFERHPENIPPYGNEFSLWVHPSFGSEGDERKQQVLNKMRPLVRNLQTGASVGEVTKIDNDYTYGFERVFGTHQIRVVSYATDTCEIVETGETKEKVTYDIPDEVREQYRNVEYVPVTTKHCPKIYAPTDLEA